MILLRKKIQDILLLLLLFVLPWQSAWIYREIFIGGEKWQYGTGLIYMSEILLGIVALFFIVDIIISIHKSHRSISFFWSRDRLFFVSLCIAVMYVYATSLWAFDRQLAYEHAQIILEAVLLFLLIIVSPNTTKQMITIFLLGASFSALLGIIQFLLQDTFVSSLFGLSYHDVLVSGTAIVGSSARWLRAYGSFSHPNIFGGYMLVASVYGVYMIHRGEKKYRAWYYLLSTICIVALFLSFSRSALLAGAVVLLIILSFFRTILHKTFILYLSALVVILIVLLYPLYISRVSIDSSHEIRSIGERVSSMHVAHDMIRSHFFFGIGMGNYSSALMSIVPDKPGWYYQPVHMVYALMQTEIGFFGCLLFFVSFLLFLYWIFEYNKNILQTLVIVCCFIFAVIAVFDHYLFSMYSGVILCAVTMAFATRNSVLPTD